MTTNKRFDIVAKDLKKEKCEGIETRAFLKPSLLESLKILRRFIYKEIYNN